MPKAKPKPNALDAETWEQAIQLIYHEAQKPHAGLKMFLDITDEISGQPEELSIWKKNLLEAFAALNNCLDELLILSKPELDLKQRLFLADILTKTNQILGREIFLWQESESPTIVAQEDLLLLALKKLVHLIAAKLGPDGQSLQITVTRTNGKKNSSLAFRLQCAPDLPNTDFPTRTPSQTIARQLMEKVLLLHDATLQPAKGQGAKSAFVLTFAGSSRKQSLTDVG